MTILLLACVSLSQVQVYGELAFLQELLKMPSVQDYDIWDPETEQNVRPGLNRRLTQSAKKLASFPQRDIRKAYLLLLEAQYGVSLDDPFYNFVDDYCEANEKSRQPALNLIRRMVKRRDDEYEWDYEQRLYEALYLMEENAFILNRIMFDCNVTDGLDRPLMHYYNFINWNTPELSLNRQRPVVLSEGLWSIDIYATGWGGNGAFPTILREYDYYSRRFNLRDLSRPTTVYGGERADLSLATAIESARGSGVVNVILTMTKMPTVWTYFNAEPGTVSDVDKRVTQVAEAMLQHSTEDVRSAIDTVVNAYKQGNRASPIQGSSFELIRSLYTRGESETRNEHDYRVQTMIVHLYHNTYFLNRLMFDCDIDDGNDETVYTHSYNSVSPSDKSKWLIPVVFRDGLFGIDWELAERLDWDGFLDPLEEFDYYRKRFEFRKIESGSEHGTPPHILAARLGERQSWTLGVLRLYEEDEPAGGSRHQTRRPRRSTPESSSFKRDYNGNGSLASLTRVPDSRPCLTLSAV